MRALFLSRKYKRKIVLLIFHLFSYDSSKLSLNSRIDRLLVTSITKFAIMIFYQVIGNITQIK